MDMQQLAARRSLCLMCQWTDGVGEMSAKFNRKSRN